MGKLADHEDLKDQFPLFERAAAKGHEESIWIMSVWKDVEMEENAWKEAFARTEEPLGWWFAGRLSDGREQFDFFKKSAEAGCSWGQVKYGRYFRAALFVEKDEKAYLEWLEKAANQNNPRAMYWLGIWVRWDEGDKGKAISYYRAGVELGCKMSMGRLAEMLNDGNGCAKDLRQAAVWGAQGSNDMSGFCDVFHTAWDAFEEGTALGCNYDQLCYSLGWGLYWYQDGTDDWDRIMTWDDEWHEYLPNEEVVRKETFVNLCLDCYCENVELQQKSIFMFLWWWNQTVGVKDIGRMIGKMVWEGREDNLVRTFEQMGGEEPEMKRIKN
jgi:hypothetical protein